ncbi:hypothetical protein ES703_60622 [subsurface metagenome]
MVVVATLLDGRTIVRETACVVVNSGDVGLSMTFSEIDTLEWVLEVEVLTTSPPAQTGVFSHKVISQNLVAITLMDVSCGCTLCFEAIGIGM